MTSYRTGLVMPIIFELRTGLVMPVACTDEYRTGLAILVDHARRYRTGLAMVVECACQYRAGLVMPVEGLAAYRAGLKVPVVGVSASYRTGLVLPVDAPARDEYRTGLVMPVLGAPSGGSVSVDAVSVTRDSDGVEIHCHYIRTRYSRDDAYLDGELRLSSQADFLRCPRGTELTIVYNGEVEKVMVEHSYRQRPELVDGRYEVEYVVKLTSTTEWLAKPWALPLLQPLGPGLGSEIAGGLAVAQGHVLAWNMVDDYIRANLLYANDETPAEVIRKFAGEWGGVMQTLPDGTMQAVPYYPVPVDKWDSVTPDLYLNDGDHIYSMSESPDPRDGYNSVRVQDQLTPQSSARLDEVKISATEKIVYRRKVPFDGAELVTLHCSRPEKATIEPLGLVAQRIDEELVAIEQGSGATVYPISELHDAVYGDILLGTVTPSEDGTLVTDVVGQSLLLVSYTTQALAWRVRSSSLDDIQLWTEVA